MRTVRFTLLVLVLLLTHVALLLGCGTSGKPNDPAEPVFSMSLFGPNPHLITNPHFPLVPGTTTLSQSETDEGMETLVSEVLAPTRVVAGLACRVVRVREYLGELLVEDAHDWYAQDAAGNVWYMGEDVVNYEYDDDDNLVDTNGDGSWEAGLDIDGVGTPAAPGIIMKSTLVVGDTYRQEFYPTVAEDMGGIAALNVPVALACGTNYTCLQTRDWNLLEPGVFERKFYAPGIGVVAEEVEGTDERVEMRGVFLPTPVSLPNQGDATFSNPTEITNPYFPLAVETMRGLVVPTEEGGETVIQEVLDETRVVNGVTCRVLRVREYEGDLLKEDTKDWFAQDDAGNVWYFGEEVVNYEYDDDDNLVDTNDDGSWEAGVDGALAGVQMWAAPAIGVSYYQEFYAGEAEDMAVPIATGVSLTLRNGISYDNCLKTLEWTPLEPSVIEFKYYAPGVGLIQEQPLDGESEGIELLGVLDTSLGTLPNFAAATFSVPEVITNPYLPFVPGTTWDYEVETDEGTETIFVEVLATTRVVNGLTCTVVRDRVFLDGLEIEDTHDWYAQDDAGNVWYMGEDVINYEYDENGVLIGTDNEGAWEAGVDGALPGIIMWAVPTVGTSYRQEFYEDEAEDMAVVIATGVSITLGDGTIYNNCVQVLEWSPLGPESLEYKFAAPGIGVVLELKPSSEEAVELVGP